jgi:hypothetical protein
MNCAKSNIAGINSKIGGCFNHSKAEISHSNVKKFSSCLTEITCLHYEGKLVNVAYGKKGCSF